MKTSLIRAELVMLLLGLGGCESSSSFFRKSNDPLIAEAASGGGSDFWAKPQGQPANPPANGQAGQQ